MHAVLNIAIRAARRAGAVLVRYWDHLDRRSTARKGLAQFVAKVGKQAEEAMMDTLLRAYPEHGISSRGIEYQQDSDHIWIIDALNGRDNYMHGLPRFSISLAFAYRERTEYAVVYYPLQEELFTATKGSGAQLDERRIRVNRCNSLDDALLGTGFSSRDSERFDTYLSIYRDFLMTRAKVRQTGCSVLDLASVAAGRFDGFWDFGLRRWDMAAGALLVQEAGGIVTSPGKINDYLRSGNIVAGNLKVGDAMMRVIQPYEEAFSPKAPKALGDLAL
uniref:Inositol-1-monophosphatase n=1 Tax=Candidatus Kentrum sp. MB TaxID=2138164 RepID=A0A450X016_9GAMM|nr:MAG: myo-inositol-1(or 4)-monophosphatase [Candidatus Kentron sp. MB]